MLRTEEARNRRSQAPMVASTTKRVPMTRGTSLRSRVKGNFQARFWNSGGRGDSPADCGKLSYWFYRKKGRRMRCQKAHCIPLFFAIVPF